MTTKRHVILYIAASLDGYIAKPGDDLSFLSIVQQEGEDYGYGDFIKTVDTVILGRKTFDWVMNAISTHPHPEKDTYVITRTPRPGFDRTTFYTGDLKELVADLKARPGAAIFCDGGAEIVHEFLSNNLLDELVVSVIPVLLGNGTRLFKDNRPEQHLSLVSARSYSSGLVQLWYKTTNPVEHN